MVVGLGERTKRINEYLKEVKIVLGYVNLF